MTLPGATVTLPVHDPPHEHRWHSPTVYGPMRVDPDTGDVGLPFGILGPARCSICGAPRALVVSPREQIAAAARYLRDRYGDEALGEWRSAGVRFPRDRT